MTVFRMITGPQPHGRDREVGDAVRSRRLRSLFRSTMIVATAPALMGVTLALLKFGWTSRLSDAVERTFLSEDTKKFFLAATPSKQTDQLTSALLLCLATASVILAILIWLTRLYLARWERRAEDLLSLRYGNLGLPLIPILCLVLITAAVCLPPYLGAPLFDQAPQINLAEGIAFILLPALVSVLALFCIVRIRFRREVRAAVANGSLHPDPGDYLGDALS